MSAGGYEMPQSSSFASRYDHRRPSGSGGSIYDRSLNTQPNRRSASPTNTRRPYDSYGPSRSQHVYREEHSQYPNVYRPAYGRQYYGGHSPNIERYPDHSRTAEQDHWGRQPTWNQQQSGWPKPSTWEDPLPPSPTGSSRSRGRDDILATRMYEPSDAWKQANPDRMPRDDVGSRSPYPPDPYMDSSPRIMDSLNDGFVRPSPRPHFVPVDRYRANSLGKRPSYPNMRSDSYRPSYDAKRDSRGSFHREPSPPRNYRPDPISAPSRPRDHSAPSLSARYTASLASQSGSRSPERRFNGRLSPQPHRPGSSNGRQSELDGRGLSRPSSRSSIASTHVSDTQTAPPAPIPPHQPNTSEHSTTKVPDAVTNTNPVRPASAAVPSSSTQQPTLTGPQTLLANRFKALHAASAPSSPPTTMAITPLEIDYPLLNPTKSDDSEKSRANDQPTNTSSVVSQQLPSGAQLSNGHTLPSQALVAAPKSPSPSDEFEMKLDIQRESTPTPPPQPSVLNGISIQAPVPKPATPPATEDVLMAATAPERPSTPAPPSTHPTFTFSPFKSASRSRGPISTSAQEGERDVPEALPERKVLLEIEPLFPLNAPLLDKPNLATATSLPEALRAIVMTRLLCDQQTRDELVIPVLNTNRFMSFTQDVPIPTADSTPNQLIEEIHTKLDETVDYPTVRPSLAEYFEQRQSMVTEKIQRLSNEYISLHRRWKEHCQALNAQTKANLGPDGDVLLHGRTTRRTSAWTDAVRSDLEMEQVIASLGVEDLSDAHYLSARNAATIPDMIPVVNGTVDFLFDDTNHLVEDPTEYYAPHTGIDDWTDEEKLIFLDKFALYPKQFGQIAEHLPHKTAAQCVDYYYLHKKQQIDFRKVVSQLAPGKRKRRGWGKKKANALLADIQQHDAETGKDNLSTFVVPSRVAKGKRRGRAAALKTHSSAGTPGPSGISVAATLSTSTAATPQPETTPAPQLFPHPLHQSSRPETPDSRLGPMEDTPAPTPTPEPESRARRATRNPKPVSVSVSASAVSSKASTPAPPPPAPPPMAASVSMPPPAPSIAPSISAPPMKIGARIDSISAPPTSPSRAQSSSYVFGIMTTGQGEPKPRKARRQRKQVKSAAIIIDEPDSPTIDSRVLPSGTTSKPSRSKSPEEMSDGSG